MMTLRSEESTSSRKEVAFFGGAFDPITIGHIVVAWAVNIQVGIPVCFSPCFKHRFGKQLWPPMSRLAMIHSVLARCLNSPQFFVSQYEIDKRHNGSMFQLLEELDVHYPEHKFRPVIGADNLLRIKDWDRGERLLAERNVIVVTRPEYDIVKSSGFPATIVNVEFGGSSTNFRKAVAEHRNEDAQRLVHSSVWEYITKMGMYGYRS